MPDYGKLTDHLEIKSGSLFLFKSGSLTDPTTAISASVPQIVAITCSSNFNNRLTKLTTQKAFGVITVTSGSSKTENDTKIVLRYVRDKFDNERIFSSSKDTIDHLLGGVGVNIRYVDIPLNNNDDSYLVALKTINAFSESIGLNTVFSASIVDDTSGINPSSSLGVNMAIGSSFKIRNSASLQSGKEGKILITSLNSGSVAQPDFTGTEVQIGGMEIGDSFKVGGDNPVFTFNIVQSGSGNLNQPFFEGNPLTSSAQLSLKLDPDDKNSAFISGSGNNILFFSGSGEKLGIRTKIPLTDVDIRANEFQVQKLTERRGLRINNEGNIESFDKNADTATTGSEFILNFSRGVTVNALFTNTIFGTTFSGGSADTDAVNFFNNLRPDIQADAFKKAESIGFITPPQVGDTLGAIRWIAESGSSDTFDKRGAGEAAVIKAVVSDGASDGIATDLIFSVADRTGGGAQKLLLDAGNLHELTGSLNVSGIVEPLQIRIDGTIQHPDQALTKIDFNENDIQISAQHSSAILKIQQAAVTINPSNLNFQDFFVRGDTDNNLIATDAGNDKVGIGTASPTEKLEVVGNIKATGNIIAQQYIVSSSVTNITYQALSGSTIFGDSTDDTHTFTGHVTSSGNISSSGDIYADDYYSNNQHVFKFDGTSIKFTDDRPILFQTNITSSGNISASGEIIGTINGGSF